MTIEKLVNPHIRELSAYVPGKPIEAVERELGISGSVKLASNENPLGPSPKAIEAISSELAEVNRYPDGGCFRLRSRLSERLGVAADQLIFGCGADEVLELVVKTFLAPGDEVVMPWPSFAMYPIVTQGMGGASLRVPLNDEMKHDLPAMAEAVSGRTKIVFVCNPNNPTGTSFSAAEQAAFVNDLPDDVVLVIDEAYVEFARRSDFPDSLSLIDQRPATLILRTFSKIYGLAGLRVGYGISSPELIGFLDRARHPFNVNRIAEAAALAALEDEDHAKRSWETNASGAEFLTRSLEALGHTVWPTDANFLLVEAGEGVVDALLREGIIVRPLAGFGLPRHLRVSIGTAEENERAVKAFARIAERDGAAAGAES